MNALKCAACKHYDPLSPARSRAATHGWCAAKSLYPYREGVGQVFPAGVRRVDSPEKPAKPVIVRGAEVVASCLEAQER